MYEKTASLNVKASSALSLESLKVYQLYIQKILLLERIVYVVAVLDLRKFIGNCNA